MGEDSAYGKLIEELRNDISNMAVLLVGKAAKVDVEEFYSLRDVDIVVIKAECDGFQRQIEDLAGLPLDISFIGYETLKNQIIDESFTWIEALATGRLEWASDVFLEKLEELTSCAIWKYAKGPERPDENGFKYIRYEIGQSIESLERKLNDPLEFQFYGAHVLDVMIEDYFILNGIWLPKHKKRIKTIESVDNILYCLIQGVHEELSPDGKLDWTQKIAEHILEPFGGILYNFTRGKFPLDK